MPATPSKGEGAGAAHTRGGFGVLKFEQALVSWGDDRSIRFWTKAGDPIARMGARLGARGRVP